MPSPLAVLELLKPITWFPPMWAYGCGLISAGVPLAGSWTVAVAGMLLAGPMVCGTSQAVNDWFDRHVDALNEPGRPIPSGRMPGRWGLYIAVFWTVASLILAAALGLIALAAAACGLILAWAYSAPPLRLKRNGWWGNSAVALCYEGLPWVTAVAVLTSALPDWRTMAIAMLYSVGAHGIMTLNDFKSIDGDRQMGVGSIPVRLGPDRAARLACAVMAVPQTAAAVLLMLWGAPVIGGIVIGLVLVQLVLMVRLLGNPRQLAPWYNATGVSLYVLGMLASAFALSRSGVLP
jgi:chlorophyll synthase